MKIIPIQNHYRYLIDFENTFISLADWKQMRDWCMLTWGIDEVRIYNGGVSFYKLADAEWFILRWS